MADKKESALGAVTDFAQARVLDASGASKNISKADMASVLAGVIGNPVSTKGVIGDLNAHPISGIYTYTRDNTNNIPDGVYKYGLVLIFKNTDFSCQILVPHVIEQNNRIMIRVYYNGSWLSWFSISVTAI